MQASPPNSSNQKLSSPVPLIALWLAILLCGCSVGFDVPLSPAGDAAWADKLLGYWKVEREGREGAGVALLHKSEDGTFKFDALGPDGGLLGADLIFASHGGRDYAVLDFVSLRTLDPGDPAVGRIGEQTVFGVPLLPAGVKSYGIALIQRETDRLTVYELDEMAVKADLAGGALAGVASEGCDPDKPVRPVHREGQEEPVTEGRPHWACILQIGEEAALRGYLERRGDAIFDLERPVRMTKLF